MYDLNMLATKSFSEMRNIIYKGKHLIFAPCFYAKTSCVVFRLDVASFQIVKISS